MKEHPLLKHIRRPDLSVLGSSIKMVPPQLWKPRMIFAGALDVNLKKATGAFPATFRKDHTTHPVFVLKNLAVASHQVCPCSSKGNPRQQRYVPRGCRLEMTDKKMDRDSFLVEKYSFILPGDSALVKNLFFLGRVPPGALKGRGGDKK
jgi:hypothetical protein